MNLRLAAGLCMLMPAPLHTQSGREIFFSVDAAAEHGTLAPLHAKWRSAALRGRADALLAHGVVAHQLYQFPLADSLLRRGLKVQPAGELSRWTRIALARVQLAQANPTSAMALLRDVASDATQQADSAAAIMSLLLRASLAQKGGSNSGANTLLDSALALGAARFPSMLAGLYCRRAGLMAAAGKVAEMRRAADLGLAAARDAGSKRLEGACYFVRATSFAQFGFTDSLRVTMRQAKALQRESHDLAAYAAAAQWQGFYLSNLGQHELASRSLSEAWQFASAARSVDVQAWTALSKASLASGLNDRREAAQWLAIADSLMERLKDRNGERYVLGLRSANAFVAGDTATGWSTLLALIQAHRTAGDRVGEGHAMVLRVARAVDLGEADLAQRALAELRTADQATRPEGFDNSRLIIQGEVSLLTGDLGSALRSLNDALAGVHRTQHLPRHSIMILKALTLARMSRIDESIQVAREAEEQFNAWRATLSDSALRMFATRAERSRRPYATALIAALAEHGKIGDAISLAESQQARRLREQLADAASWASTNLAQSGEGASIDLADLQRQLPDDSTALLEYVGGRGPVPSVALVVTRRGAWHARVPALDSLAPSVQRFLASASGGRQLNVTARNLGRALLDPVMPILEAQGIQRLTIIPDGTLHLLPFDALQLSGDRFALEHFEISYAPSMAIAIGLRSGIGRRRTGRGIVAFGDPSTRAGTSAARSTARPALAGARREVNRIASRFPGTVARLGSAATEYDAKRLTTQSGDVIHFAVHAEVNAWDGRGASLLLTAGHGDDGILYAGEVAALSLHARLVILSACETNAGDLIDGEGVAGLTNAFLRAGASAVVTTLWSIPDRGAEEFIKTFYDGLADSASVATALRKAKISALRRGVPAATWAAFNLVGDGSITPAF